MAVFGFSVYNENQTDHGGAATSFLGYLVTGEFAEATFENWESEFLQMGMYVVLTAYLVQFWFESMQNWQSEFLAIAVMVGASVYLRYRGSAESKPVAASHSTTGA